MELNLTTIYDQNSDLLVHRSYVNKGDLNNMLFPSLSLSRESSSGSVENKTKIMNNSKCKRLVNNSFPSAEIVLKRRPSFLIVILKGVDHGNDSQTKDDMNRVYFYFKKKNSSTNLKKKRCTKN